MKRTLEQAAKRLGKPQRQVLYMIRNEQLPANKLAEHWFIEESHLPLSENQR